MPPAGGVSRTWLRTAFSLDNKAIVTLPGLPPVFLCPVVQRTSIRGLLTQSTRQPERRLRAPRGNRYFSGAAASAIETIPDSLGDISTSATKEGRSSPVAKVPKRLPSQCPGCGAFSQTTNADQPGFFDLGRQSTMAYLGLAEKTPRVREEDKVVQEALRRIELENGCEDARLGGLLREQEGENLKEIDIGMIARYGWYLPTIFFRVEGHC